MARPAERRTATTVAFGDRVKGFRKAAGLTQEQLAHNLNLSVTYVASVERGERNLGLSNLLRIADALGTDACSLVADLPAPAKLPDRRT
jgi:transcriptional regulator with XRE-family HTH domain